MYNLLFKDMWRFFAIYLTLLAGFSQAIFLQLGDAAKAEYDKRLDATANEDLIEWHRPDTSILMMMRWLLTEYDYGKCICIASIGSAHWYLLGISRTEDLGKASSIWFAKALWVVSQSRHRG